MNENRLMQQITAIFSIFMVLFYLVAGTYLLFFFDSGNLNRPVIVIMGATFIFYGVYRTYRSWVKIKEVFFTKDNDND
jgi:hypothetical protein